MVETMMQLTVRDILQRPLFQKAEAIASDEALNRTIRWVHIMEVTQVGKLLSGNELILSTGVGWHDNEQLSLSFLQQLIDSGASGLCIELGTYTKQPSDAMIELARRENFPLLLFHEEVRYIDITQDLHAYFIHQHHRMVYELEALSTKLNQLLLSGKGIMPLLKLLHHATGAQVAFFPLNAEAEFIPHMPRAKADTFYEQWIYGKMFATPTLKRGLAHRPILALDHLFADLLLQSEQELSEFQILALDRSATAIAQEMMRTKYMEERRRYKDEMWVTDWLSGKPTDKEVREYIGSIKPTAKLHGLAVCVFRLSVKLAEWKEGEELLIQKNMVARAIFEGEGYFLLPAALHDHIVFVLIDQMKQLKWKDRLLKAVDRLRRTEHNPESALFAGTLGIGKYLTDLSRARESYESAQETIAIQTDIGPLSSPFFNDLHTYRIISGLKKTGMLPALIEEYIGPLARYDKEKNGQLLKTLKVFLSLSGSKQDTARELFIVRQTLYHRLDKIATLLGDDYLAADKRLAIELALYAYEYTYGAIP
ncbi:PucR family transcriptional regulator [Paenibacillus glycanilyticus]|uniref:Transcriptional regulator n=1 Tax=Paenibacillus glycanilyticus TaxID=126569 RepID=A0ABQ6G6X8_9BACL|nr:PucR family transcriptional regulator [Paenibacillus glycanilyticus]GLX65755.1 transcriptional regulator [Paenibacillus glycanilyticus]